THTGLLEQQLTNATYECMVCCSAIRKDVAIWHCSTCFHIYHLYCIKKWANTGKNENDGKAWRCPACQNLNLVLPDKNYCFCGKMIDPPYSGYFTPHTCGDMCGKKRNAICKHPCNVPCHPGPCPPCTAMVNVACDCGKMKVNVKCSTAQNIKCQDACNRVLNCGQHHCGQSCHKPPCHSCQVKVERSCHCGQLNKQVLCGSSEYFISSYSCGQQCNKLLDCGNHKCLSICHDGPCDTCKLVPTLVTHCPCGKTQLGDIKCESGDLQGKSLRTSCLDRVPCCWKKCNKELECGELGSFHKCKNTCHTGPCPDCPESMSVVCRCQASSKLLTCKEFVLLKRRSLPVKCDNRCGSKMSCGRHRCCQNCCVDREHVCNVICAHKLTCGLHKCEEVCHKGRCPTCWRASFEELTCECGSEVIYPPVPCGTAPPICVKPCARVHPCTHPVQHKCHSEPSCPPCAILTQKLCMCGRETRANVPCFLQDVSCGRPCGKPLPCLVHNCAQLCHKAPCLDGGKIKCTQPCPAPRTACGHPCMAPCHVGQPCPPTKCKAQVVMRCECGRREEKMICLTGFFSTKDDYTRAAANIVASQLWNSQSIDLAVLKDVKNKNRFVASSLPCDDTCGIQRRNKALADALNIENANITNQLPGLTFSEFLRDFSRQNLKFVSEVEDVFIKIIKEAEKSKVGRKMHSFKVMPSNKRRLIHELAECYSIESESIDEEPHRSVIVTATKSVACLLN
ncbi:hypothetical protein HELRODRAFT_83646, partial [Helobdella robusta]|uniref:R3H domain-containing protein n=1 Tax=Helobdella robusta TaxID=6412 RepID=T1G587_HELRO